MTLLDIARDLQAAPDEDSIYAHRLGGQWSPQSPAMMIKADGVVHVDADLKVTRLIGGHRWEFLLTVCAAKRAVDVYREWSGIMEPDPEQKLDAMLYYAERSSYLPVGDYFRQEHAKPVEIGLRADQAAPDPVLLASEHRTLLAFYLEEPEGSDYGGVAVLEFEECRAAKLGPPGEDRIRSHRLWGRGLHAYGVFVVLNSTWAAEIDRLDEVVDHPSPSAGSERRGASARWELNHYLFSFRDSTFECLARGFVVRPIVSSIRDAFEIFLEE